MAVLYARFLSVVPIRTMNSSAQWLNADAVCGLSMC